ncbi:MAG: PDZ domain-containing protein [Myxococcales bacterium]|nr:PDZ domain-containing protein [Myxococcales bacterium]
MRRRILAAALLIVALLLLALLWPRSAVRSGARLASVVEPPPTVERVSAPRPVEPPPPVEPAPQVPEPTTSNEVRCRVGDALDGWTFRVMSMGDGPLNWRLDGEDLVFQAPASDEPVVLLWGDRPHDPSALGKIAWTETDDGQQRCVIDRLPHPLDAAVYGRVRGAERLDDGTVFLEGCGLQRRGEGAPLDVDGGFFFQSEAGPCRLRAWRQAGMLRLPGPWVEVDARSGGDVEVDLSVPTFSPAGMGIGFQPVDGGVLVSLVHEGTPAAEVGLVEGDVITAIDGVETQGMEVEDFLSYGIGPAGSEVHLEGNGSDGEPFEVTFHRREIN